MTDEQKPLVEAGPHQHAATRDKLLPVEKLRGWSEKPAADEHQNLRGSADALGAVTSSHLAGGARKYGRVGWCPPFHRVRLLCLFRCAQPAMGRT